MTTKHRFRNRYRLQVREKDHLPMHVHLVGGPVNVRISLETMTITDGRCPARLEAEVLEWVREQPRRTDGGVEKMASMKRPRLRAVSALPEYRLDLTFVDGSRHVVSLAQDVQSLPGLAPLGDQEAFAGARVVEGEGWTVEWEAFDIQIGADTLLLEALAQAAADDNTRIFLSWRARNGLSLSEAGRALGLTPRTISAYGTGARRVPRYIALACKGWEAERAR